MEEGLGFRIDRNPFGNRLARRARPTLSPYPRAVREQGRGDDGEALSDPESILDPMHSDRAPGPRIRYSLFRNGGHSHEMRVCTARDTGHAAGGSGGRGAPVGAV
jgi:hypothetical protein